MFHDAGHFQFIDGSFPTINIKMTFRPNVFKYQSLFKLKKRRKKNPDGKLNTVSQIHPNTTLVFEQILLAKAEGRVTRARGSNKL